ncbi:probable LRR receptor-like serine/threonine-protein kinase At3g47570 [Vicia villosa]|uniref:probable LRR receptor-like serine/threonine-protein kinase At3g47570 n=1 Tax=Vicia villosa TaxID=3911 RepID=UPI00273B011F|nr:probable LRR receptor-like serine/threonine-protein kinase At3g47570 [Vicia villosa]
MNHFSFFLSIFFYVYFSHAPNQTLAVTLTLQNQTDHQALLQFKHSITTDPNGVLDSWNSSTHFCNWHGITCNAMHQRVTKLNLQGNNLHGTFSPYIGNLSRLRNINLENNSFTGHIPHELGRLLKLHQLSLSYNKFSGDIPKSLSNCSNLRVLHLLENNFTGKIPPEFAFLQKLLVVDIGKNNLTGGVPSFIGNLSSLTSLGLVFNNLEGHIPQEICLLRNLKTIELIANNLSGKFPPCFYNMSSLESISVTHNHFVGSLPSNMFQTLPKLQVFKIGVNNISGRIPTSIANASTLTSFDIGENLFRGQVPSLGKLRDLRLLNLEINILGKNSTHDLDFLKTLTNCSKLEILSLTANSFGGFLPNSIGNFSHNLSELYLGGNNVSGKVPKELGNLVNLIILSLGHNNFEGTIPTSFGQFRKMQLLDLRENKLSGEIPSFIGNLSQLSELWMEENMFEGNIPLSIGKCQMLIFLNLSQNNLRGRIPLEVFGISSLSKGLDLSHNSFSGSLPYEVGLLKNIGKLDVSENRLSGDIPRTIDGCVSLEYLRLQGNSFNGTIPSKLSSIKGLRHLDLSRNQLSGSIPIDLQDMAFLEYLNVSFNKLEGEVPIKGVFRNAGRLGVTGNNKLCGGILELHLSPCPAKHQNLRLTAVIICVIVFLIILMLALAMYLMRKRNRKPSFDTPKIEQLDKVSYQELHQGTDGFSDRNLIGSGSFGSVYKGNLVSQDKVVAIKILNLEKKGAHKSFIAECNALKNIRHRNLVKILTCCSSTDYKGEEFKALVFDYMKNGSLEDWLHPRSANSEHPRMLSLVQRLNIMIDIGYALHYLHRECEQLVLHCDIKPSNILLDDDMVAHVSDFGITKLVSVVDNTSYKETSTVRLRGTIGYAPPEYGMSSEVSSCGDMYSFGILVLEMITGRRPTDERFEDGQNLHSFVENSFHGSIMQILDPNLVPRDIEARVEKCLVSVLRIGLGCSMESPKERMNIVDVTKELDIIKKVFLDGEIN